MWTFELCRRSRVCQGCFGSMAKGCPRLSWDPKTAKPELFRALPRFYGGNWHIASAILTSKVPSPRNCLKEIYLGVVGRLSGASPRPAIEFASLSATLAPAFGAKGTLTLTPSSPSSPPPLHPPLPPPHTHTTPLPPPHTPTHPHTFYQSLKSQEEGGGEGRGRGGGRGGREGLSPFDKAVQLQLYRGKLRSHYMVYFMLRPYTQV